MRGVGVVLAIVVIVGLGGLIVIADPGTQAPAVEHENITPGESVSGAVAAGEAEVQSDVEVRAFGHRLQAAETPAERAEIIAERLDADEETLDELEERAAELEAELEAGNISHGKYFAELTRIAAQANAVEHTMTQSAHAAEGIENELREKGVEPHEIEELRDRAPGLADGIPGLDGDRDRGPPLNVSADDFEPPAQPGNETGQPDDVPGN